LSTRRKNSSRGVIGVCRFVRSLAQTGGLGIEHKHRGQGKARQGRQGK
jgi:hypothetical protein